MNPQDKNLLSPDDMKALYGMEKSTQAKNRCLGKLPYIKFGGFIYYKRDELEAFICSHAVERRK
jgi:hypothetical protein